MAVRSSAMTPSPSISARGRRRGGCLRERANGTGEGPRDRPAAAAERELVLAAKHGGAAEREALVEAFVPLVGSVARIYRSRVQVDRTELMQEGVVGLLRAL